MLRKTYQLAVNTIVRKTHYNMIARYSNAWKDKQESTQKIYINKTQKQTLKKLLQKLEEDQVNMVEKDQEFSRRLREILKRYRVNNEAFVVEVINLHKNL